MKSFNSPVPGLTIVGILWGGITAGCLIASSSLTARYALRAGSSFTSHPITWLTSAALHASWFHLAANSICGYSFARDMRTVDAIEMFLLGCLWCGCLTTFWGLARSIIAVGSSGGICGLFGYSIYQKWDNHDQTNVLYFHKCKIGTLAMENCPQVIHEKIRFKTNSLLPIWSI